MPTQTERLWGLDENERVLIHTGSDGSKIIVVKGEKVQKYGDFDIKIKLEGEAYTDDYAPSHPSVFRDLEEKIQSNPDESERLFEIIQSVYKAEDPEIYLDELTSMYFEDSKFPADVTVYLLQQMMIEQEINYGPGGKWTRYSPPRDLLMSCVRWIFSGEYSDISDVVGAGYSGKTDNKYHWDGGDIWTRPKI